MALSRIFASAASFFAISAHCARGIFQNATYEYIGGFSLASDICADAGKTKTVDSASRHSAAKTIQSFRFIIFILRSGPGSRWGYVALATPVYTHRLGSILQGLSRCLNFRKMSLK